MSKCKECGAVRPKKFSSKEYIREYIESLITNKHYDKVLFSMDDDIGCSDDEFTPEEKEMFHQELRTYVEAVEKMFGSLHRIGLLAGTDAFSEYDNDATDRNDNESEYYSDLENEMQEGN